MDAIKFLKEHNRMCISYDHCSGCPLSAGNDICKYWPSINDQELYSKLIKAIEEWSAAHPVTTRQDIFKKVYPSAPTDPFGVIFVCPKHVGAKLNCSDERLCSACRKKYWLKEAQDGRR